MDAATDTPIAELQPILDRLRAAWQARKPDLAQRRADLVRLREDLRSEQDQDFRPRFELLTRGRAPNAPRSAVPARDQIRSVGFPTQELEAGIGKPAHDDPEQPPVGEEQRVDERHELLLPGLNHRAMGLTIRVGPGVVIHPIGLSEPTEEWLLVLQGSVEIDINGVVYPLQAGASICYEGWEFRGLTSLGPEDAVLVGGMTPPAF